MPGYDPLELQKPSIMKSSTDNVVLTNTTSSSNTNININKKRNVSATNTSTGTGIGSVGVDEPSNKKSRS